MFPVVPRERDSTLICLHYPPTLQPPRHNDHKSQPGAHFTDTETQTLVTSDLLTATAYTHSSMHADTGAHTLTATAQCSNAPPPQAHCHNLIRATACSVHRHTQYSSCTWLHILTQMHGLSRPDGCTHTWKAHIRIGDFFFKHPMAIFTFLFYITQLLI